MRSAVSKRAGARRAPEARPSGPLAVERLAAPSERDLARRTLQTVAVLVAACVLFVGLLSVTAVLVTSRAVGGDVAAQRVPAAPEAPGAKKPLSI